MLLARRGFLARLEQPPLQFLREPLALRMRFDEIGDDEGIDFLRHQLAARHSQDEARRGRPILFRSLAVLGVLQVMYAYPVAGAQGSFVTVIFVAIAAICVYDTLPWLAARVPVPARVATAHAGNPALRLNAEGPHDPTRPVTAPEPRRPCP